jgi:hypothetical protein
VFQASIGGELVAPGATCRGCNRDCSADFEAKFLNSLKILSNVLGITNRKGDVPNIDVTVRIDGRPFKGVLHAMANSSSKTDLNSSGEKTGGL